MLLHDQLLPGLLLLLALVVLSLILGWNDSLVQPVPNSSISGIKGRPGLAMEFASSQRQVKDLLDVADTQPAKSNRRIIARQQYIDFFYIVTYWAFFFFVIGGPMRTSQIPAGRMLGQLLGVLITLAAVADVLEDFGILFAVRPAYDGWFWPFGFGVTKWLCFYLALLSSAPFFITYPRLGNFPMSASRLDWIAVFIGILLVVSSFVGLVGTIGAIRATPDTASWLVKSFKPLALAFLLLLAWFGMGIAGRVIVNWRSAHA
ncbi:MAG TPA: hypothetical protein VI685_09575 [Candidatus Angelobacter sp.]